MHKTTPTINRNSQSLTPHRNLFWRCRCLYRSHVGMMAFRDRDDLAFPHVPVYLHTSIRYTLAKKQPNSEKLLKRTAAVTKAHQKAMWSAFTSIIKHSLSCLHRRRFRLWVYVCLSVCLSFRQPGCCFAVCFVCLSAIVSVCFMSTLCISVCLPDVCLCVRFLLSVWRL